MEGGCSEVGSVSKVHLKGSVGVIEGLLVVWRVLVAVHTVVHVVAVVG